MAERIYSGDVVGSIATEAEGIRDYNSVRFWVDGKEIPAHKLEMVVYMDDETEYEIAPGDDLLNPPKDSSPTLVDTLTEMNNGETTPPVFDFVKAEFVEEYQQDAMGQPIQEEDFDEESSIRREQLIEELINDDITQITNDLAIGDMSYIAEILRGDGFTSFNNLTDEQLEAEHKERNLGEL
ncbi:MAG: hypothetical protein DRJ64_02870 [Thermoprotei archaeon]|nr:MAG: hypothetical protein DRJ64_02870 [Thermoprotei archaeon]